MTVIMLRTDFNRCHFHFLPGLFLFLFEVSQRSFMEDIIFKISKGLGIRFPEFTSWFSQLLSIGP